MSLLSKIRFWGKKSVDQAVGVTSGSVPVPFLDGPQAFRWLVTLLVIAFGVSGWLVYRTIGDATKVRIAKNTNGTPIAQLEKLRSRDTDGDGISDYDELFVTHTSPYLKDSDSDGRSDQDEITKNSDPNCPQGKSCNGITLVSAPSDTNAQLTPQFLRQALLTSGVPQTTIDQLNDTQLLTIYQDAASNANTNTGSNTNSSAPTRGTLNSMSPAEIRKLLISSGLDSSSLDNVDDATLQQIFQEAINQSNTNQ